MKGLELSEKFYYEYGERMIQEKFPQIEKYIAVGLVGSGSECFGFDDELSVDHDFEPGFCIFIPGEELIDSKTAFLLERAYAKLPKEFMGFRRNVLNPVGGNRHGVIRISDFLKQKTGTTDGNLSLMDWFFVPEQSLAELENGKIFHDGFGVFTEVRERFAYLPEDVRLKKLAANLLIMGQSGQYNYNRCIKRNDSAAAQLSVIEFAQSAINVIFLINRTYAPYYKWSFKALKEQKCLCELSDSLEYIISSGNGLVESQAKSDIIEQICEKIIEELRRTDISEYRGIEMENHAYSVNDRISDSEVRNLNILFAAP